MRISENQLIVILVLLIGVILLNWRYGEQPQTTVLTRQDLFGIFIIVLIIEYSLEKFKAKSLLVKYTEAFLFSLIAFAIGWRFVFIPLLNSPIYEFIILKGSYYPLFYIFLIILVILFLILYKKYERKK
jgi:hypothetical protein